MKKISALLFGMLFISMAVGSANATMTTIGTATYNDGSGQAEYKLIWDDDNNGNSVVWLDYTVYRDYWSNQVAWATGLDAVLTVNLYTGYSVNWSDDTWRLPTTLDGRLIEGHEGDPDGDGSYNYTAGYNLANSEMGHLYYEELGNAGYQNTDGSFNATPPGGHFLEKTGDFDNLTFMAYWSDTDSVANPGFAWVFSMNGGNQGLADNEGDTQNGYFGMAIRSGQVSMDSVPEPSTVLLFGIGLLSLAGVSSRKKEGCN